MGLFGRNKRETTEQLDALRAELTALRDRLDSTDAAKARLEANIGSLHAENGRLRDELLVQITTATSSATDATRSLAEQTAAHLDDQRARLADLAVVATDAAERSAAVAERTDEIDQRLGAAEAAASDAASHDDTTALAERVSAIDVRLGAVATELTNQLTELGNELDAIDQRTAESAADDGSVTSIEPEVLDELRDAQERLAAEQARYQVAFRADLADLADRLRRAR